MNYLPSYNVARRLTFSPRCLSMLTGSFHVRLDKKRVDVGLCIKNAPRGLCVPDYAKPQPEQQGWLYSPSLIQLLEKYKVGGRRCIGRAGQGCPAKNKMYCFSWRAGP